MPARGEPLAQRGHRRDEHDDVLSEAPAVVHGARAGVRRLHLEVEVLDALRGERLHDGVDEGGGDTARGVHRGRRRGRSAARAASPFAARARTRQAAVALREECEARSRRSRGSRRAPAPWSWSTCGRRRHSQLELAPEALEHGQASSGVATRIVIARCVDGIGIGRAFATGPPRSILGRVRRRSSPSAVAGITLLQHAKRRRARRAGRRRARRRRPARRATRARPSRANRRSAASATQRSEIAVARVGERPEAGRRRSACSARRRHRRAGLSANVARQPSAPP